VPIIAFTPYVAGLSVLAVGAIALMRARGPLVLGTVAAVALVAIVAPRAFGGGGASEPAEGQDLTVMSANLLYGGADAEQVVELVREHDVDLLSLQELTPRAVGRLRAAGLDELLDESVRTADLGASGSGLYAALSLTPTGAINPGEGFLMPSARLQLGETTVNAVAVHPVPPTSGETVTRWRNALRALPATGESAELGLLLGDFNATLDHNELREVIDRGYIDAADATGDALTTTWSRSVWPPITIDHLLVDDRIHVVSTEVIELEGSDHKVVVADLVLPTGRQELE
jgi:endonuclease/exonuclease/phosphatase family metal-dependent hydrolase